MTRFPKTRQEFKDYHDSLRDLPRNLEEIDTGKADPSGSKLIRVWRSKKFLVQLYIDNGYERLSINRTCLDKKRGRWRDGLTWDDLMQIKRDIGMESKWAIEIYPPDAEIVDVENLRHLWLVDQPPMAWVTPEGWQDMDEAPRDGTAIVGLYENGEECLVRWAETRRCMLAGIGGGNGYFDEGWECAENRLIVDDPIAWRPEN